MSDTILVTGASGSLGGAIVRHLLDDEGVAPSRIIAVTRDPSKLSALAARGVDVRAGDFDDEASLAPAFAGAGTVLIVSTDAMSRPGQRLSQHLVAVAAAAKAGAARIAYTSLPDPEPGNPITFAPDHHGTESAIAATGIAYTFFRNGWYQENLLYALPHAFGSGQWFGSTGDGRTSYALRDDIARAIAASLANPPAGNAVYTLTGAESYTRQEVAALASEVVGKPVAVVDIPDEQFAAGLKGAGLPDPMVTIFVSFDAATRVGKLGQLTQDIEKLTGRRPTPLKAWLEANKAAFGG